MPLPFFAEFCARPLLSSEGFFDLVEPSPDFPFGEGCPKMFAFAQIEAGFFAESVRSSESALFLEFLVDYSVSSSSSTLGKSYRLVTATGMFVTSTRSSGIAVPSLLISPSWNGFLERAE